jgi:hypothetical protein
MAKFNISWHRNSLKNSIDYYNKRFEDLQNRLKQLSDDKQWNDFYKYQIESAEKEGKDSFDKERYKVKKLKD